MPFARPICGVLQPANEGITPEIRDFEAHQQDSYTLQAQVLQLRNQLYRQRRIRTLNERTLAATSERSDRVECLVAEMRTDLKSLKSRLDEELKELGIDHERAEAILGSFYLSQQDGGHEEEEDSKPAKVRLALVTFNGQISNNCLYQFLPTIAWCFFFF